MVTNHQQQILTNPLLPPSQVSQNFSYSIGTSANNFPSNLSTNETLKPAPPSSSSTIESMENSHLPLSLSNTNETISSSILSDTSSTTQTQVNQLIRSNFNFYSIVLLFVFRFQAAYNIWMLYSLVLSKIRAKRTVQPTIVIPKRQLTQFHLFLWLSMMNFFRNRLISSQ